MSNLFDGYEDHFNADVRLIILRALSEEADGRLNSTMLIRVLESFAVNRTREYVHTQLRWLEKQAQAVMIKQVGTILVAELTQQGEDHLSAARSSKALASRRAGKHKPWWIGAKEEDGFPRSTFCLLRPITLWPGHSRS